jgi:two-component system sensor histidine kinase NreB
MLRLPVKIEVTGRSSLPLNIEYALYKIGVEGLTNITKHACKEHGEVIVNIFLDKNERRFKFRIQDNGSGFDMKSVLSRNDNFGIHNMQRWAQSINGTFEIKSQPQQGTCILINGSLMEGE